MNSWAIWVTVILLLANAFFVGAGFAAMAARRSQLEPLAEGGSSRARVCLDALEDMGSVLACAQVGITVCSVLLGAVSEAALHHALLPLVERAGLPEQVADGLALALALLVVVYLHVVVGEMIPKNLAIADPGRAALVLVPALYWLARVARPFVHGMAVAAKAIVRVLGVEPRDEISAHITPAEMAHIVEESHREGLVEMAQVSRLGAALEFSTANAAQVGVALDELVTVQPDTTPAQIERLVAKHGFSRYPVVDDDGDPIGYLHLKDVLYADEEERRLPVPAKRVRRLATVRGADELSVILRTMQSNGSHVARAVGRDGSVLGVVFLEDVIEQLVGEVSDATRR